MATMAGSYCCSYYPATVRSLQRQAAGRGGRGLRRASLRAAAAEPVKAATDAEFFQPSDTRPIMLFDGVCNLCNGGVRFVREHDPGRSIRYIPLQSDSGRKLLRRSGRSPDDISSVVLVEKDRSYIKSDAVLRIMEYLNLPFPQLAALLKIAPLFVRDFAYDNVADNRLNREWPYIEKL
ncbi:DCC family protein [Hordeum vulgare]|nr:DCC family protein [Hordeum vulgare]